ncbi:MAG: hypothetical protein ACTSPP_10410 [Candidatus Heimdallarchaeaceae archaeon]
MERKLNNLEYLNFSLGQPYNLVVVFHINGFISEEELREALEKVQKKHPLLRVRIKADNKGSFWFTSDLFLKHLETPFDLDDKSTPLFRATLLTSQEQSALILCALHTISDGISMVLLTKDLIQFLNNPDTEIKPITTSMNKEDILPTKVRKKIPKSAFLTKVTLLILRVYYFLKFGKKKEDIVYATDYKENDLRLISWNLSEDETKHFLKLCKLNKVSVHSAICTAFLPDISAINNPVNLRGRLNYPIGEAFGLYSGGTFVKMKYNYKKDFWKNAKKYQKKLLWALRDKKVFGIHKIVHTGVPLKILNELAPIFFEIFGNQEAFAITNLGSLDRMGIDLNSENFSIQSFYGAVSFAIGAITVLVYTMRGKMYFNLHYLESRYDAQKMQNMADKAKKRILTILNER